MLSRIKVELCKRSLRKALWCWNREQSSHKRAEAETEESEEYAIENDELYSLRLPHQNALEFPRIMLPRSQRSKVMEEAHNEVGHRAVFTTMRRIQSFCVWPGAQGHKRIIESKIHTVKVIVEMSI